MMFIQGDIIIGHDKKMSLRHNYFDENCYCRLANYLIRSGIEWFLIYRIYDYLLAMFVVTISVPLFSEHGVDMELCVVGPLND